MNILWLQNQLKYLTVSRCVAGMQHHPMAMGTCLCQSYRVKSSLAVVVFFIVKSEIKRLPGKIFKQYIGYIAANFQILNRIAGIRSNINNFKYESNIHPILIMF